MIHLRGRKSQEILVQTGLHLLFELYSLSMKAVCSYSAYGHMTNGPSFFCIFPFLPKMVETMGIPEQNVGFYTGLIVSALFRYTGMCG